MIKSTNNLYIIFIIYLIHQFIFIISLSTIIFLSLSFPSWIDYLEIVFLVLAQSFFFLSCSSVISNIFQCSPITLRFFYIPSTSWILFFHFYFFLLESFVEVISWRMDWSQCLELFLLLLSSYEFYYIFFSL